MAILHRFYGIRVVSYSVDPCLEMYSTEAVGTYNLIYSFHLNYSSTGIKRTNIPFISCADLEKKIRGGPTSGKVFYWGQRIHLTLQAGHHLPTSESPLNGVSLAGR